MNIDHNLNRESKGENNNNNLWHVNYPQCYSMADDSTLYEDVLSIHLDYHI